MKFTGIKTVGLGIAMAAFLAFVPQQIQAETLTQNDGVMGQSIEDETDYHETVTFNPALARSADFPVLYGAAATETEYFDNAFTTEGDYTSATYYHRGEFEKYTLINGIDVSWWQAKSKASTDPLYRKESGLDWEKIHNDGIDFAFVRVASRDTKDGSLYEDTCADSHIQNALDNDINVGLYVFSQALTEKEAIEEANYVLNLRKKYGWDVTMPIIMDREAGKNKRLTAGKLSKAKETAVCQAFADTITDAGYKPGVYASASWFINYIDMNSLQESGCKLWLARYNNSTDKKINSTLTYEKLSTIDYEFWQYSSVARVDGYSGNLDVNFWYKDTSKKTTGLKMTGSTASSVSLSWSSAGDVTGYRVYRYDSSQDKFVYLGATKKKSYTDSTAKAGKTYQYKVRGYWTIGGTNYYGGYSNVLQAVTPPSKVGGVEVTGRKSTSVNLGWNAVSGASGYRIYQYDEDEEAFVKLKDVSADTTGYTVSGLYGAKEYRFKVRAYRTVNSTNYWGSSSSELSCVTNPSKTGGLALQSDSSTAISLEWKKVSRASGYQIYRLNPDTQKYERIATIKTGSTITYQDTGLTSAKEYTYKVRAYKSYDGATYYGSCSDVTSMITKPAKVSTLKLSTKSKSVTLSWNKVSRATGYQIYRLNTKTGKYEKVATVKGSATLSYKNSGLKTGSTYTYKVRAYKTYNGKTYYGSFSASQKIKAK